MQDSNPRAGAKAGAIKHKRKCMQLSCHWVGVVLWCGAMLGAILVGWGPAFR